MNLQKGVIPNRFPRARFRNIKWLPDINYPPVNLQTPNNIENIGSPQPPTISEPEPSSDSSDLRTRYG
jgi:hypothetical protein